VRLKTGDDKLTINMDRTGTEITVDSKGKVTIRGTTSVSVRAGQDLSLQAGRNLTIKSGGTLNILGQAISARSLSAFNINALNMTMNATTMANISAPGGIQLNSAANIGIKAASVSLFGLVTSNMRPV
jgi:uncharacterized protein (DUF2345 family)